jgi:hypothetical protein
MTTNLSGAYELDLSAEDIISEAYAVLQAEGQGETLDGGLFITAKKSLNRMLKLWEAQGIHLWTYTEYTLFFVPGQEKYDLRVNSGADLVRVVNEFTSTSLAADEVATDVDIEVNSATGMSLGQAIGVMNNSNALFWTVIETIAGTTISLRDALAVNSNENNIVRFYDTADLVATTAAAGQVATDTEVQLVSSVGFAADYTIQITQDDGTVLHTTINAIDFDTDIATIDDALTDAVTIGNDIVAYSSEQNFIPFSRIPENDAVRRHSGENSDYEIPIVFQSREEYMNLPNKKQRGTVIQSYFDRQEPAGVWYVWNNPDSAVEYLNYTAERQIQLIVNADDTFDLPTEWYDAVVYQLAKRLIHKVGCSAARRAEIREDAKDYLDQALAFDSAIYPIRLKPQKYG